MTKKEIQKRLDTLRKRHEAFKHGTEQWNERVRLEMLLDNHLYDKEKDE